MSINPLAYFIVGGGFGTVIDLLVGILLVLFLVWLIMTVVRKL